MSDPVEKVLAALRACACEPKRSGQAWKCRCPAHDDRNPSLSVATGDDGRVLVTCHANHGCTPETITAALGLKVADLFPANPGFEFAVYYKRRS